MRKKWRDDIEEKVKDIADFMQVVNIISSNPFVYPTGIPITYEDIKIPTVIQPFYVIARLVRGRYRP